MYILHKTPLHNSLLCNSLLCDHTHACNSIVIKVVTSYINIWHHKLGHPSNEIMHHMSKFFHDIKYHKSTIFHDCHLSKHCKFPFLNNNNIDTLSPITNNQPDRPNQLTLRKSTRQKKTCIPSWFCMLYISFSHHLWNFKILLLIIKHILHFISFIYAISISCDPSTYNQAIIHPQWDQAMDNEIKVLTHNNTWTFTTLPPGKKEISFKWVYKTKFNSDVTLEKHKVRLLFKGFTQVEGIYLFNTFSLVTKLTTVRLLLSLASSLNLYFINFMFTMISFMWI